MKTFTATYIINGKYAVKYVKDDPVFNPLQGGATMKASDVLVKPFNWTFRDFVGIDLEKHYMLLLGNNPSGAYQLGAALAEKETGRWAAFRVRTEEGKAWFLSNGYEHYWVSEGDSTVYAGRTWRDRKVFNLHEDPKGKSFVLGGTYRKELNSITSYVRQHEARHSSSESNPVIETWTWQHLLVHLLLNDINVYGFEAHKELVEAGFHKHSLEMAGYSYKLWASAVIPLHNVYEDDTTGTLVTIRRSAWGEEPWEMKVSPVFQPIVKAYLAAHSVTAAQ